jgi:hemerythrin-like metal-binding protein
VNHALAIRTLTECGAPTAALQVEHAAIETSLRTLKAAILAGASGGIITSILDVCVDFCVTHFESEEEAMRKSGYAHLEAHHAAHNRLLKRFQEARACATGDSLAVAALDGFDLLQDFEEHIRTHDTLFHMNSVRQSLEELMN